MRARSDAEAQVGGSAAPGRRRVSSSPSRLQGLAARLLGLALGVVLAGHSLADLQIPQGPPLLPMSVSASVVRSGEVGLVEGDQLFADTTVWPGDDGTARGDLLLASETAVPVDVAVRDVGLPIGLEDHLWLRVTVGEVLVFEGTQARLRRSSSRSLTISPGVTVPIDVVVGLLPGADSRIAGRRTEIRLQLLSPAAGGSADGSR